MLSDVLDIWRQFPHIFYKTIGTELVMWAISNCIGLSHGLAAASWKGGWEEKTFGKRLIPMPNLKLLGSPKYQLPRGL